MVDIEYNTAYQSMLKLGFDAVSLYAMPGGTTDGLPFSDLTKNAMQAWNSTISMNATMIPLLPTGWDPRFNFFSLFFFVFLIFF